MLRKANIQWSAKTLYNMVRKKKVNFDSYVQRNLCWDQTRNSLLIHSILAGYPIPAFYAAKQGDNYCFLDGKQRSNAIISFIDNKYPLCDLEGYTVDCEDGSNENIDKRYFQDLSEELQDRIKEYSLTIYYFDSITEEEIEEMFFRLNNGKSLSAIELTRVKTKSLDTIKKLAEHRLFNVSLTENGRKKYSNEDIVIKTYLTLFETLPSYETKYVRSKMETADITLEQQEIITKCFDRLFDAHQTIKETEPKVAQKIKKKTHLLSLMPSARDMQTADLIDFIMTFFAWGSNTGAVSINADYNEACTQGSSKAEKIQTRLQAMKDKWTKQDEISDDILEEIDEIVNTEVA